MSVTEFGAMIIGAKKTPMPRVLGRIVNCYVLTSSFALLAGCSALLPIPDKPGQPLVQLRPIVLDSGEPEQEEFGRLTLLSAFELHSRDPRFGGLSGLSVSSDGQLYAVSDRGYWVTGRMHLDPQGRLTDLTDWRIKPLLAPDGTRVQRSSRDAEALTRVQDGSFIVAFEGTHRLWRYPPAPATFNAPPKALPFPTELNNAPSNGGIEGIAALPDGQLLVLTEEFQNPDGAFKGWVLHDSRFAELSYFPSDGFRVTDCAALSNGDVIVLERRYVPLGILKARVKLLRGQAIRAGAKLRGEELLELEYPLSVDNFEGIAVDVHATHGTLIYLVSDDNYHPLQQTLLLQFRLGRDQS